MLNKSSSHVVIANFNFFTFDAFLRTEQYTNFNDITVRAMSKAWRHKKSFRLFMCVHDVFGKIFCIFFVLRNKSESNSSLKTYDSVSVVRLVDFDSDYFVSNDFLSLQNLVDMTPIFVYRTEYAFPLYDPWFTGRSTFKSIDKIYQEKSIANLFYHVYRSSHFENFS